MRGSGGRRKGTAGVRSRLTRIAAAIVFVPSFFAAAFGLYGWHVMHSDFMQDLKRRSVAYGCIDDVHDPKRPRARAAVWVARNYMGMGEGSGRPRLLRNLRELAAYWVVDWSTKPADANRMFAALPHGRFAEFNSVARFYAGKDYCALDSRRKQAILDLYSVGSRARIEAAMRGEPGA